MTGNVALDIFIGIVFVYLLYSLLATIIMEIIASFLGLRARNLNYALKRMLKDEKEFKCKWGICNFFLGIFTSILKIGGWSVIHKSPELYEGFIKQPSIKYLSSASFFSNPSYITSENFAKALVDTLKKDSGEGNLLEKIKTGISNKLPVSSDTRKHLESLLEDANNDIQKFRLLLENWFDNTQERVIGWYKKNNQIFLLIIGFILAVTLNANTFHIIKKLSKDDKAREQLVLLSVSYLKENQDVIQKLDSLKQSDAAFPAKFDSLLNIREDLRNDIAKANSIVSVSWPRMDSIEIKSVSGVISTREMIFIDKEDSTKRIYYPVGVDKVLFEKSLKKDKKGVIVQSKDNHIYFGKGRYLWSVVWKNIWGYVITALFISLGAPFWFDMLNKVVKLRTSVAQAPSSVSAKKSVGNTNNEDISTLNRKG